VIEKVAVRSLAETKDSVAVGQGSVTAKDCAFGGQVKVDEGAKLLLQKCTIHDSISPAVCAQGTAGIQDCIIQDCIIQDCPVANSIAVAPTGKLTIAGTTIRHCMVGLAVQSKVAIGKACSITACTMSGV